MITCNFSERSDYNNVNVLLLSFYIKQQFFAEVLSQVLYADFSTSTAYAFINLLTLASRY